MKKKQINVETASLLFRRRRPKQESKGYRAKFIADAASTAFSLFVRHLAGKGCIDRYTIVHGAEPAKRVPAYYWARIESLCIGEDGRIPQKFSRNSKGLLKPRYI